MNRTQRLICRRLCHYFRFITPSQPKAAGDILAHGISAATIEHSNDLSPVELTPENICDKNIKSGDNRMDDVDSAPSREGRILVKENVYDNDCKNSQISNSENNSECSQLSEVNENPKNVTCYSTVCILISCKNICTRFSIVDLVLILGSIGLYIFDTATDILNGLSYYNKREENKDNLFYFILTMVVIVLPSFIMQAFSIWWEWEDDSKRNEKRKENGKMVKNTCCKHFFLCIVHVLQVGPIYRYIRAIHHGVKSRRRELQGNKKRFDFYDKMWKYQLSDVSFLRVMESYLESAPQVVLQIYIMIKTMQTPFITVLSCCVSIIGMSSMLVSWQRNLRDTLPKELNKKQISICGTIMLFLYRTCTITARVFALALLLIVNIWAWLGFFVGHWVLCFIW
uniref:XK-related protein n=1 Tax=Ciona savignyi TaxID=51511 RepID=H2YGZ8_CIOSA